MTGLLRACVGLIVWAVAFSWLYAVEGAGCALGWDRAALRVALVASWVAAMAVIAAIGWRWRGRSEGWIDRLALGGIVVGLVATLWTGMPVAVASLCL